MIALARLLVGLFNSWFMLVSAIWLGGAYFVVVRGCFEGEGCNPGWRGFLILALAAPAVFHVIYFIRMGARLGLNVRTAAMLLALWGCTAVWLFSAAVVQLHFSG
jgi:hypothetical protein